MFFSETNFYTSGRRKTNYLLVDYSVLANSNACQALSIDWIPGKNNIHTAILKDS